MMMLNETIECRLIDVPRRRSDEVGERKRGKRCRNEERREECDGYLRVVSIPTFTLYYNIFYMGGVQERALVFAGI